MKMYYFEDEYSESEGAFFEWADAENKKMLAFFDKVGIDESSSFKRDFMLMKHIKSDEELEMLFRRFRNDY